jgi:hypothetical protein
MNQWWGYRHVNGSVQVKRYFDLRDFDDAKESPFCEQVVGPFKADGREEAIKLAKELLKK